VFCRWGPGDGIEQGAGVAVTQDGWLHEWVLARSERCATRYLPSLWCDHEVVAQGVLKPNRDTIVCLSYLQVLAGFHRRLGQQLFRMQLGGSRIS
jgi:hypothetical protein